MDSLESGLWITGARVDNTLSLLSRLGQEIGSLLHWETLLHKILSLIQESGGYSRVALYLWEGNRLEVALALGEGAEPLPYLQPRDVQKEQLLLISPKAGEPWLLAPLVTPRREVGLLALRRPHPPLSEADLNFLKNVAPALASALEVGQALKEASTLAYRDSLTDVANQGYFYLRLKEELALARRKNSPLSIVMIDADGLKEINDRYGHLAGDEALKSIARLLKENLRASDTVARYGGDEFALVFPETAKQEGERVLSRVIAIIEASSFNYEGQSLALPSVSFGLASLPQDGDTPSQLLASADRALYSSR